GDMQATVTFTAPTSDGGNPISGYTVTSSPGGLTATGAASPLTVLGLTNGTAYTFTVTAANAIGTGAVSAASNSVTPSGLPTAPTTVTATAGNTQATVTFSGQNANGSPINSYTVTSNPGGITAVGAASPITVTGLTNGTAYTFTVTATNGVGTSPVSVVSNAVTPVLSAPAAFTAIGGATYMRLSWQANDPSITGFTIQRGTDAAFSNLVTFTVPASARLYIDQPLPRHFKLYYRIQANSASGSSTWVTTSGTTL
ncbi:MAG: fibronectin type III domain-containing protein, partial [Candidatus Omnitrophota bacterium]